MKKQSCLVTLNFCICDSASLCDVQIVAVMQAIGAPFVLLDSARNAAIRQNYGLENVLHVLCLCPMISSNYSRKLIARSFLLSVTSIFQKLRFIGFLLDVEMTHIVLIRRSFAALPFMEYVVLSEVDFFFTWFD